MSNTARAGVTAFLKTLAREVAADGVTVSSVQPGSHDTDRIRALYGGDTARAAAGVPVGFLGDAGDFGSVVAFLCSEQARFVTGAHVPVDGGAYAGLQSRRAHDQTRPRLPLGRGRSEERRDGKAGVSTCSTRW